MATRASLVTRPKPIVWLAHGLFVFLGLAYVFIVLSPDMSTSAANLDGRVLYDSLVYIAASRNEDMGTLIGAIGQRTGSSVFAGIGLTNIAVIAEGMAADMLLPGAPLVLIFMMNYALLLAALHLYRRTLPSLGLTFTAAVELVILLNPFLLLNMVSLTKEIWGVFFVAAFVRSSATRSWMRLAIFGVLSMLVREYYIAVAAAMGLARILKHGVAALLVGVAGLIGLLETVLGLGDLTGYRLSKSVELGQQSAPVMETLGAIQSLPFGHIVAFPAVLAVNVLSPALNPHSYEFSLDLYYVDANTISSFMFAVLILWGIRAEFLYPTPGRRILRQLLLAFAIIVTIYPISQHRYLLAAYPLLVAWALAQRPDISRTGGADRNDEALNPRTVPDWTHA